MPLILIGEGFCDPANKLKGQRRAVGKAQIALWPAINRKFFDQTGRFLQGWINPDMPFEGSKIEENLAQPKCWHPIAHAALCTRHLLLYQGLNGLQSQSYFRRRRYEEALVILGSRDAGHVDLVFHNTKTKTAAIRLF